MGDVAGLLKLFLRDLPEPLMTYELYQPLLANRADVDKIRELLHELPKENFALLQALMRFLGHVVQHEDVNHMSTSNIAIVIGPNLLRPAEATMMSSLADTPNILSLTKVLVDQRAVLFEDE